MRRSTPNCSFVARAQRELLSGLESLDADRAIGILEPLVRPERSARLREVFAARLDSVTVLMDAPHDPHNGAAVLRSCDAFGVQRLHIVERHESFLAANSVARGSERWVDVHTYRRSEDALARMEQGGFELLATRPDGELVPEDLAVRRGKICIVLGNERAGIAEELGRACRSAVRVPMRGFAESLNVSVTAALLLHATTRGRPGDLASEERRRLFLRALILTVPRASEILEAAGMTVPKPAPRDARARTADAKPREGAPGGRA
jgi:tRNA (guanosine-2'-O-)-methyltransferase